MGGGHSMQLDPSNVVENDALPPIVLFDYQDLKRLGRTPRSPEDNRLHVKYDDIDRESSLVIFVSHCWLRGYPKAPGYDKRAHPDTKNHDKLKLIFKAIENIKHGFVSREITKVFLWLDYGCIDQDASACLELKMLDKIIQVSDLILTPIFDEAESFPWFDELARTGIDNLYDQYGSPAWNKGDHAYLNRAWCRIEMFYAANIPLTPSSPHRIQQFKAGLLTSIQAGLRPHILYGSCEDTLGGSIRILPPLKNSWFSRYNPTEGKLTKETDRVKVKTLVDALRPLMTFVNEGYEGERRDGKIHGKGIYRYANGDVYEGDWKNDKMHGKGIYRYADGGVYEGDWEDDKKHGKGIYRFSSGNVYDGDWKNGNMHGKGIYRHADGDVYEGDYEDDKKHGKGIYRYAYCDVYEGDYVDERRHGKGIYRFASGAVYEGDYQDDKYHGKGIYRHADGDVYEGDFIDGNMHGKGIYRYVDGAVYEGDYEDDKKHGKGVYRYASGDVYEGDYEDDKKHGKGIYRYADGRVEHGTWENGTQTSESTSARYW